MDEIELEQIIKLRIDIVKENIIPTIKSELSDHIKWRNIWLKISIICNVIAHIFMGITSILSFVASSNDNKTISFVAGSIGVVTFVFMSYSQYANVQHQTKTKNINRYMSLLNLKLNLPNMQNDSFRILRQPPSSPIYNDTINNV